jgi:hypothetical protein
MRRISKLPLVKITAIVGAAMVAGAAITGVAVATTSTATHPVTLCADSKGNLTYPGAGKSCTSKQTAVDVASNSDVAGLASRMDVAEATIAAQKATIDSQAQALTTVKRMLAGSLTIGVLRPASTNPVADLDVEGVDLKPGSEVTLTPVGTGGYVRRAVVAPDGTASFGGSVDCWEFPVTAHGVDNWENSLTATLTAVEAGCAY